MEFDKYEEFDFNYGKIMDFCNRLSSTVQQIKYLKWILIELEHLGDDAIPILKYGLKQYLSDMANIEVEDDDLIIPEYTNHKELPTIIQKEIDYREKLVELSSYGKLNDNQTDFQKIRWRGSERQLLDLVNELGERDLILINMAHYKQFIVNHFVNRKGLPFKNKQLSEVETRNIGKGINPTIKKIMQNLDG